MAAAKWVPDHDTVDEAVGANSRAELRHLDAVSALDFLLVQPESNLIANRGGDLNLRCTSSLVSAAWEEAPKPRASPRMIVPAKLSVASSRPNSEGV